MNVATTPESFEPLESAVARIVRGLAGPRPGVERHDASDFDTKTQDKIEAEAAAASSPAR